MRREALAQPTLLPVNGVELCVQTFGDRADPAILLIAGTASSLDWWEEGFCARLTAAARFVIRYDHRDTGQSVSYPAGEPGYAGDDLVDDAVGVLDALELRSAHLAGISGGAAMAVEAALDHPDRVASLGLMSTTSPVSWTKDRDLPGLAPRLAEWFASAASPDWSDRAAVVDWGTGYSRALAGDPEAFDEAHARELWGRVFDRTVDVEASMTNHDLLHDAAGRPRAGLDRIAAPTVVIHGTSDPMFPLEHGAALAEEIPGARLVTLDGVGHELPRRAWDEVVSALVEVSAGRPI